MNKYSPLKFSIDVSRYIRDFCYSLKNTGVINFVHDITFGHGEITMLMADSQMFQFYFDNKVPVFCTNESGRYLSEGMYINRILKNQYRDYAVLISVLRTTAKKFGLNYGKNSLHYVVNEADCQHLYSLFFEWSDDDFLHFVINNGALIQDMVQHYNYTAKDIILEAKALDSRIILPCATDYTSSDINQLAINHLCLIHKKNGLLIHLSPQRSQCMLHLLDGKSTKEIAQAMRLTPKTVDHYLEILRKELGCSSSKDLILSYIDQLP
ncbi:MAG TPA: helix-turn-helix transcriptional regulator [Legionellaceae bacterium]|nr:helix-turn-helix transcriptional regulator [Legionellaceae bacterium]